MRSVIRMFLACLCFSWGAAALAQTVPGCGSLQNRYGPFDYRDPYNKKEKLPIVEGAHFTWRVQTLEGGESGALDRDIDYTLRAFPNHYPALNAAARFALQGGVFTNAAIRSADCFFKRAIVFVPDDETVFMLYGNYLAKRGQRDLARAQYEKALELAPDSAEVNYNAGLFFLDDGHLQRAKELAAVAYASGYPLPGLKNKIAKAETAAATK